MNASKTVARGVVSLLLSVGLVLGFGGSADAAKDTGWGREAQGRDTGWGQISQGKDTGWGRISLGNDTGWG